MKFKFSKTFVIDSNSEPWATEGIRIGIFGGSGSGKSYNNALIAEQFLAQGGTVVIFETRSEFQTLKEKFSDILVVGGVYGKDIDFVPLKPKSYAKAVVEDGINMIFYTTDVDDERKLIEFVSAFLKELLRLNELHKRPILIIVEEAHEYAPRTVKGHESPPWVFARMTRAFKVTSREGRKLNIVLVVSTQRPQELDFTIRQLANISFYGLFSSQDISYINKECLAPIRKTGVEIDETELLALKKGQWLVVYRKTAMYITVTQPRMTKHGADTPKLEYVAPLREETGKSVETLSKEIQEALKQAEAEESELKKAKRELKRKAEIIVEKDQKIQSLDTALTVASKLEVKTSDSEQVQILKEEVRRLSDELKKRPEISEETTILKQRLDVMSGELKEARGRVNELEEELEPFYKLREAWNLAFPPPQPLVVKRTIPSPLPSSVPSSKTCKGLIREMWSQGWFSQPRALKDVDEEMRRRGYHYNRTATAHVLLDLVKGDILSRQGKSRNYRYVQKRPL